MRRRRHMDSMMHTLSKMHTRNQLPTMLKLLTLCTESPMRKRQTTIFSLSTPKTLLLMRRRHHTMSMLPTLCSEVLTM